MLKDQLMVDIIIIMGERVHVGLHLQGGCRWLCKKGREIDVVMREDEAEDYDDDGDGDGGRGSYNAGRSHRRHVFEDIDIDLVEGKKEKNEEGGEEEKARVSICIPPKNALLLMRCRSDPVKMAALANRFWESPVQKDQHEDEDEDDEEEDEGRGNDDEVEEQQEEEEEEREEQEEVEMEEDEEVLRKTDEERNSICEREREGFENSEENHAVPFIEKAEEAEPEVQESLEIESRANPENDEAQDANEVKEELEEEAREEKEKDEEGNSNDENENCSCVSTLEAQADPEEQEETQEVHLREGEEDNKNHQKEDENDESSELSSTPETLTASEPQNDEAEPEPATKTTTTMAEALTEEEEASTEEQQQNVTTDTPPPPPEVTPPTHEGYDPNNEPASEERESGSNGEERERERETLPECLLLMMCEPKLSMEVSKETWVCSTDFIRWLPERPAGKNSGAGARKVAAVEGRNAVEKKSPAAPPVQPPRSSCSFPAGAGVSMAAMIEQRLAAAGPKSNGYEPFVLTRCKSEPMRSSAKLATDACFWKKRHAPPATLGVGAPARVGC